MLRGTSEAVDEVSPIIGHQDFYSGAHQWIWDAIDDLASRQQPIDTVQVGSWLKDRNDGKGRTRLEQVGGMQYLMQIADAAPVISATHLQAYAKTVANRARMRRLAHKLRVATIRLYGGIPEADVETFFDDLERDIGTECAKRHAGELRPVGPLAKEAMQDLRAHDKRGGGIAGISTGFTRFDRQTGGLHDGDLTIVAARPGLGKTAFVMGICDSVTELGHAGVLFSLEMPAKQLAMRLMCSRGRVNLSKTRTGAMSPTDWTKLSMQESELWPRWIHIDDTASQSWAMIKSKLRKHKALCKRHNKKLAIAIVDFLQLMKTRQRKNGETRSEVIGEITRDAKATAKELEIPIVILSQLNREVEKREDKRPIMSDLRDSGEIEQDADNVVLLYRDDYYNSDSDEKNIAEAIIGKQRNGPTGTVRLRFDREWTRFDNLSEADEINHPTNDGAPYEHGELYHQPEEH